MLVSHWLRLFCHYAVTESEFSAINDYFTYVCTVDTCDSQTLQYMITHSRTVHCRMNTRIQQINKMSIIHVVVRVQLSGESLSVSVSLKNQASHPDRAKNSSSSDSWSLSGVASFPGSCVGRVKSLVHTVCACSVTPGFLRLWKVADTTPQYHSIHHRIIVCCTCTIEDDGAFRRVWEWG